MKRRRFIHTTAALALSARTLAYAKEADTPAILGGAPVKSDSFPSWPMIEEVDEKNWKDVLNAKGWCRLNGGYVEQFEDKWAEVNGVKDCIAVANGTNALFTSLKALDIGPGDEVIVPPYTFVATVNAVLLQHALPVFVDTDRETFQIDARKIEEAITENTRCIMPVHLGGNPADMDTILAVAKKHNIPVVEDACQAHLGEWKGQKVGSLGSTGCFSFQVTKNLSGGEGGAVLSNDTELLDKVYAVHTNGRERTRRYGFNYHRNGTNVRMTEFQGALLLAQITRLPEQAERRSANAAYLTKLLSEIPGIAPAKQYEGTTRNALHLYMFRYDPEKFAGLPRAKFMEALQKEGVPCTGGYSPLNKEPFLEQSLHTRGFQKIYSKDKIDAYLKNNHLPENDALCEEAVWFFQEMLLAPQSDMDKIAEAIQKISRHAAAIQKA